MAVSGWNHRIFPSLAGSLRARASASHSYAESNSDEYDSSEFNAILKKFAPDLLCPMKVEGLYSGKLLQLIMIVSNTAIVHILMNLGCDRDGMVKYSALRLGGETDAR